jgi:hypothetical protein
VAEAEQGDDLGAQLAARHGVDGLVNRLLGEVQLPVLRVHALEGTRRLLGRQPGGELLQHRGPGRRAGGQLWFYARFAGQTQGPPMSLRRAVQNGFGGRSGPAFGSTRFESLRLSSRLTVDAARLSTRAIARVLKPLSLCT